VSANKRKKGKNEEGKKEKEINEENFVMETKKQKQGRK
jgi:hypothetical protein